MMPYIFSRENMNSADFRKKYFLIAWEMFQQETMPLDLFLSRYFKRHPSLGSKDREWIRSLFFKYARWQSAIEHTFPSSLDSPLAWVKHLESFDPKKLPSLLPDHLHYGIPLELWELLSKRLSLEDLRSYGKASLERAPLTIRANTLKCDRTTLKQRLCGSYDVFETPISPLGLTFARPEFLQHLPEFKEGLFEIQDEGSQLASALVQVQPGQHVLDYCCGSAGKTLAFAPSMQGKGQIYLHDIRDSIQAQARKRLLRAGVQNFQYLPTPLTKKLHKKMDWVLVDAPCTGSGTFRRNPDLKWKFSMTTLQKYVALQKEIVQQALPFLKPQGRLVYMTCSILTEENEAQVHFFENNLSLKQAAPLFQTRPQSQGMDGFFGATLQLGA